MIPPTVTWDDDSIVFIDQTLLPAELSVVRCNSVERLGVAIQRLEVRGAPALGVAGGYGIALAALNCGAGEMTAFFGEVSHEAEFLKGTRPTAVNLAWGIERVVSAVGGADSPDEARKLALREARAIEVEDTRLCHSIGEAGASVLPETCTVLTHCNAGALACSSWGTALGVIRSAAEAGKTIRVFACETRPLNQGSRLTAWELSEDGIDVTVITDSSAAFLMRKGLIDAVIVGADRICHDAVFNKIGTYMHAVSARHHGIPFYVAAPYSTFDWQASEEDITIELRSRDELAVSGGKALMPEGVPALNYAFDATPIELLSAIFTEKGVLRSPFSEL